MSNSWGLSRGWTVCLFDGGGASRAVAGRCLAGALGAAIAVAGAGCRSLGARHLPVDRFDYNTAIAASANEQMLLNLVRLHHGEVPTFLAVNSVLTQYVWTGELGIAGAGGESLGFPAWSVGGSVNARYIERPTVTYSPLSGQEFAAQLLSPVRADVVFSLVSSGWPPEELLSMTIQRINDVQNIGFASPPGAGAPDAGEFGRVVELLIGLARRDAIELVRTVTPQADEGHLEFAQTADPETTALLAELRERLGVDPAQSRLRVTRRIVGRGPDEITIRMHSLLELMGLLSSGVVGPGSAPVAGEAPAPPATGASAAPLVVHRGSERPDEALVAVRYGDEWYHIARSDEESKRAFGLLIYLFQMQASQGSGVGPMLTVPVG